MSHEEGCTRKSQAKRREVARLIVQAIEDDLLGRGVGVGLDLIGVDGQALIREGWVGLVADILTATKRRPACCAVIGTYVEKYDAYACAVCMRWLEPKCDEPSCEFCPGRPETPEFG